MFFLDWMAAFMNNLLAAELGILQACYTIPTVVLAVLVAPYAQERWGRRAVILLGANSARFQDSHFFV